MEDIMFGEGNTTVMPFFNVHVFTTVRVKIEKVQAASMEEAIDTANESAHFHDIFDHDEHRSCNCPSGEREWAEDVQANYYLVDPLKANGEMERPGDVDYEGSAWYGPRKEKGIDSVQDLFYKILDKKELLPVLMGIDENLDKLIVQKLKE